MSATGSTCSSLSRLASSLLSRSGVSTITFCSRAGRSCCARSEEHTSELQSLAYLVCRLLLEKKNQATTAMHRLAVHAAAPVVVHADRLRIDEVIVNLLEYAINDSPPGDDITVMVQRHARRG